MITLRFRSFITDRRCWLLLLTVVLAGLLGFHTIPNDTALTLVSRAGFWFVLIAFVIWSRALWQTFVPEIKSLRWKSIDWVTLLIVGAAGFVLLVHERRAFKIIMDEIMLLGTSMDMHLNKTVFTPIRGHDVNGAYTLYDGMLDKRPLFFPFLVSLLHDVFGYRPANAFALNSILTFVFLSLVNFIGSKLIGRMGGWLAVVLFAGLPLLAHNSTGGGFELLNLTMIAGAILLGARWFEKRDAATLVAFCFTGLLLAQVRYESVIFLLPVAAMVIWVWVLDGKALVPWALIAAPLLMVHLPLHQRVFQIRESSWEMMSKPGYTQPFSLTYVVENIQHALAFFFGSAAEQPNSLILSTLGFVGFPFFVMLLFRRVRNLQKESAIFVSVTLFSVALALHFFLLMCYFWGKFDEPIIRRLSLPAHLTLVVAIVTALTELKSKIIIRGLLAIAVLGLVGRSIPSMATHAYSQNYLPGREVAWRREFMKNQPRPDYFMIDRDSILWVTHGVSVTPIATAIERREDLAFHMRNRTFSNIYVFQRIEIEPETGDRRLRLGDDLGPAFILEPVIEERLEVLSISRISRVKEIRTGGAVITKPLPIAPRSGKSSEELERARRIYYENYMKRLP
jgi:hypothetical protein